VSASSANGTFAASNAVDGNAATYWESSGSFPQWIQVDLGSSLSVGRLVLRLPSGWGARTQTIAVSGSTDGSSFASLAGSAGYTFDPGSGNSVTVTLPGTSARYLRLSFTGNTGWAAAQLATIEAYAASTAPPPPAGDLARGRPTAESSHTQTYGSANVVDGDAGSYWESANNAFPQWVQADLGSSLSVGRVVLRLPAAWGARSQTIALTGSTDGSTFSSLSAATARAFAPASGNAVTVSFTAAAVRYVRATFTANSGWAAGQLSALEAYGS
jgi:hypothetical protein